MDIPITGYLLIPLGLMIAALPWRYCLIGLVVFSMMSPAAVVNYGKFGLQPGYYLSILLSARTAAEIMMRGFQLNRFVLERMRLLFYFNIVVFVVLFIALCFFQGKIEVLPGSAGFKSAAVHYFHLSRENYTQIAYLILNITLVYTLGHQGGRRPTGALLKDWDLAICCGLCFSVAIALWQFVGESTGLFFPAEFFYSNAGYNRADSQSLGGLFRINGCFEEPSTLGYMFSGYILFAWVRYRQYPTAFSVGMIAACVVCMLLSTSTTAMLGVFLFFCTAVFDFAASRIHLLTKDFKLSSGQLAAIGIVVLGGLGMGVVLISNWQAIRFVIQTQLLHKSESTSGQQRMFADLLALRIFVETYGIGIGLGSDKANSMLMELLSNTGIAGLALLGSFVYSVLRPVRGVLSAAGEKMLGQSMRPFQWGVIGLVMSHCFDNPNVSVIAIWVFIGGLIALKASLRRTVAGAAVSRAAPHAVIGIAKTPALSLPPAG